MSELIKIGNQEMSIKEWAGKRVVTFADIDKVHERPSGTARKRFRDNIKHFRLNIDYFLLKPEDFRMSEKRTSGIDPAKSNDAPWCNGSTMAFEATGSSSNLLGVARRVEKFGHLAGLMIQKSQVRILPLQYVRFGKWLSHHPFTVVSGVRVSYRIF